MPTYNPISGLAVVRTEGATEAKIAKRKLITLSEAECN